MSGNQARRASPAYFTTPRFRSARTSAGVYPASASTFAVCLPSVSGAGVRTRPGVALRRKALPRHCEPRHNRGVAT